MNVAHQSRFFQMSLTQLSGLDCQTVMATKLAYGCKPRVVPQYQFCQIRPGLTGNCLAQLQDIQADLLFLESQIQAVCEKQRLLELYRSQLSDGCALLEQLNSHVQILNCSLSESLYPLDEVFEEIDSHVIDIQRLFGSMDDNLQIVQKRITRVI